MKVIVIGAKGTIGKGIVKLLSPQHEIVPVGHSGGEFRIDLSSKESIEDLYREVGRFEAVVSAAGAAKFGSLDELGDADYMFGLTNKLMGQVNLVRVGREFIADHGSFTLTSGILAQNPMPGSSSVSMINAGLEGFVRGRGSGTATRDPRERGQPHLDQGDHGVHGHGQLGRDAGHRSRKSLQRGCRGRFHRQSTRCKGFCLTDRPGANPA